MSTDITEDIRRQEQAELNARKADRARLEGIYGVGNVWDTEELTKEFDVEGFLAPFVVVRNRQTGQRGSMSFQHMPRFYFDWVVDRG